MHEESPIVVIRNLRITSLSTMCLKKVHPFYFFVITQ